MLDKLLMLYLYHATGKMLIEKHSLKYYLRVINNKNKVSFLCLSEELQYTSIVSNCNNNNYRNIWNPYTVIDHYYEYWSFFHVSTMAHMYNKAKSASVCYISPVWMSQSCPAFSPPGLAPLRFYIDWKTTDSRQTHFNVVRKFIWKL